MKLSLAHRNVLVTGGACFIGIHLVELLACRNPGRLVVIDNFFLGSESNLAPARELTNNLIVYREDASKFEVMADIVDKEKIDVVFNLAVIPLPASLERPRWTVHVNFMIASVFAELARLGKFRTLVHFSSSEAYGSAKYHPMDEQHPLEPLTPYAASKVAGDHLVLSYARTFGIDAVILRPFNNFGPRQNDKSYAGLIPVVMRRSRARQVISIHGDGEQTRDYVFVRDTALAAVKVYEEPSTRGHVVNVATGQEVSVNDLITLLGDALGAELQVEHAPARPGDVRRHCGGSQLLRQMTGFVPRGISKETLAETIAWYNKNYDSTEYSLH